MHQDEFDERWKEIDIHINIRNLVFVETTMNQMKYHFFTKRN